MGHFYFSTPSGTSLEIKGHHFLPKGQQIHIGSGLFGSAPFMLSASVTAKPLNPMFSFKS